MECDVVRSEHPTKVIENCCPSCHEDDDMGFGYDLWCVIDGKDRHVCCAVSRSFRPSAVPGKET
jgi:hypothetical protein